MKCEFSELKSIYETALEKAKLAKSNSLQVIICFYYFKLNKISSFSLKLKVLNLLNEVEIYYHVKYTDTSDKIKELKNKIKENNEAIKEIEESENGSDSTNTSNISLSSDCQFLYLLFNIFKND